MSATNLRYYLLITGLLLGSTGCRSNQPMPLPAQFANPAGPNAPIPADSIDMGDPAADMVLVRGISRTVEGNAWRWSGREPEMEFSLLPGSGRNFFLEFDLPEVVFRRTGAITVSALLNGSLVGSQVFSAGRHKLVCRVPDERLRPGLARVALRLSRTWTDPADGREYGLILLRAGFLPDASI